MTFWQRLLARFSRSQVRARVVGHVDPSAIRAQLHEATTVERQDFRGLQFDKWTAVACRFVECDFSSSQIEDMCFGGGTATTVYERCKFDGARLGLVAPGVARFVECSFREMIIRDANFADAEFVRCVFSGRLTHIQFWANRPVTGSQRFDRTCNEIVDNDWSGCVFKDVSFRGGVDLARQRLPDGPEYVRLQTGADARGRISELSRGWTPSGRRYAEAIRVVLENEATHGQVEVLANVSDLASDDEERALLERIRRLAGPDYSG